MLGTFTFCGTRFSNYKINKTGREPQWINGKSNRKRFAASGKKYIRLSQSVRIVQGLSQVASPISFRRKNSNSVGASRAARVADKQCGGLFYAVSSSLSSVGHVRSPLPSCVAQYLAFQEATLNRKNDGCGSQPRETGRAPPLTQIHDPVGATMVGVSWETRGAARGSCPSWFCLFLRSDCYHSVAMPLPRSLGPRFRTFRLSETRLNVFSRATYVSSDSVRTLEIQNPENVYGRSSWRRIFCEYLILRQGRWSKSEMVPPLLIN